MKYKMLKESDTVLLEQVKSQPYLKQHGHIELFRGISRSLDEITKLEFKFRTQPLDTYRPFHDKVNELSIQSFGIPIRNLLFTYPDMQQSSSYGTPHRIVPIGNNYELYYASDIVDMTADYVAGNNMDENILEHSIDMLYTMDTINDSINSSALNNSTEKAVNALSIETDDLVKGFHQHMKTYTLKFLNDDYDKESDEYKEAIAEYNSGQWLEKLVHTFKDNIEMALETNANEYIEKVEVVEVDDELDEHDIFYDGQGVEIMVHAPDGFYVIPTDIYYEELFN